MPGSAASVSLQMENFPELTWHTFLLNHACKLEQANAYIETSQMSAGIGIHLHIWP